MGQQAETALAAMLANQGRGFQGWGEGNIPSAPPPPLPDKPPVFNPTPDPGGSPPGTRPSGEGGGGGDTGPGAGGVVRGLWSSYDPITGKHYHTRTAQPWIQSQATPFLQQVYGKYKYGSDPGNRLIRAARSGNLIFNPNDPTQYHIGQLNSPGFHIDSSGNRVPNPAPVGNPWSSFSQFDQQAQPIQHALSAIEERWNARRARKKSK
jgi:hypothetical protein